VVSEPGKYYVLYTSENGCQSSDTITVKLYPVPKITSIVPERLCLGDILTVTAKAIDTATNLSLSGGWDAATYPPATFVDQSEDPTDAFYYSVEVYDDTYFDITFTDEITNCIYYHTTNTVIVNEYPYFKIYTSDDMGATKDESRYDTVHLDVTHKPYFLKVLACAMGEGRATVEYTFHKKDINGNYVAINQDQLNSYLLSTSRQIFYTIDLNPSYFYPSGVASSIYSNPRPASTFPYSASSGTSITNSYTPNGGNGNNYFDWFWLHFFNDRFITVDINSFFNGGDYMVTYKLIQRYYNGSTTEAGAIRPLEYAPDRQVGGYSYYNELTYISVLAMDTIRIHVERNGDILYPPPAPQGEVSIDDIATATPNIAIYPNPASEKVAVKVKLSNFEGTTSVRLVTLNGKMIRETQHFINDKNTSVDLSIKDLSAGVYFVVVTNNDAILTRKLIIQ